MAKEIKRRLFSSRKVIVVMLALVLVGAAVLAMSVFAQGDKVTLTLGDAQGYVGDEVWVNISISGISDIIEEGNGICVGSFKLPYQADIADIDKNTDVRKGVLLSTKSRLYPDDPDDLEEQDDFICLFNNKHEGNVLSFGWVSNIFPDDILRFVRDDGILARIKFTLKSVGNFELDFSELLLNNVDGVAIESSNITVVPGTITVLSTELRKVDQPTWDGDVIKWTNVENAKNYEVKLYKGGTLEDTQTVNQGTVGAANSYNFKTKIDSLSPGIFTVTVQAKGDNEPWTDGAVSDESAENRKTQTLAKVAKPVWDGWNITWNDVTGAESYEVKLYLDSGTVPVKTVPVNPGIQKYDFSADTAAAGSYTATVQAKGDGTVYLDGDVSDKSDAKVRKVKLATVDQPTLSADGILAWSAVENAASYEVQLFKNNISVAVLPPTELFTQNLLELMRDSGAGAYTAKVTALAEAGGYYEDGDASVPSVAQTIVQLVASQPTLSDKGVAGWSAVTNADGYTVQLYKDGSMVDSKTESGLTHDFLATILEEGPGSYTVTVTALGTGLYLNSAESAHSAAQTVSQLPAPTNVRWDVAPLVKWDNVAGATGYLVQLYKGGAEVGGAASASDGTAGHDLTALIGDAAGYYTAKVQALGDGYLLLNSPYSDASDTFTKTGPLGQVTDLNLSDRGLLTWVDEPEADNFVLQLYKGGSTVGDELIVAKGVQSANFRTAMRNAGLGDYYVTVTAKGSGLFSDGPALDSNSQAVSKLAAPTNVSLSDKGVSAWERDEHASQSNVRLYLPAGHPSGQSYYQYSSLSLSKNHLAEMRQFPGDYYVKVWVEDIHGLYLKSDESEASKTRTVVQLAKVDQPILGDDGVAEWVDVTGAISYAVALYKGALLVATETVEPGEEYLDLSDEISAAGSGSYTVTVTALGDEYLLLDGDASDPSDAVAATVLGEINELKWFIDVENEAIFLTWREVEGAAGYEVVVYSGHDDPQSRFAEINSLYFNPDEGGFYWAEVRALGSGIVLNGPFSERSDILVIFETLANLVGPGENNNGSYRAQGNLPVPGYLWMQILSATGNDGVMVLASSTTSDHPAPEGLIAAGIFFDIVLDENLQGSSVALLAGYDALPARMDAASLCFYRYDAEKGWVTLSSEVNTTDKNVMATVDHFSTVGLFGKVTATPVEPPKDEKDGEEKGKDYTTSTFGYRSYLPLAGLILVAAGLLLLIRRRQAIKGR